MRPRARPSLQEVTMGTALKEYARCFYEASVSIRNLLSGRRAFALGGLPGVQFVVVGRQIAPGGSRAALAIAKGTVSVGASTSESAATTSDPTRSPHHRKLQFSSLFP